MTEYALVQIRSGYSHCGASPPESTGVSNALPARARDRPAPAPAVAQIAWRWGRRGRVAPIWLALDRPRGSVPASTSDLTLPSKALCRRGAQRHPGCTVAAQRVAMCPLRWTRLSRRSRAPARAPGPWAAVAVAYLRAANAKPPAAAAWPGEMPGSCPSPTTARGRYEKLGITAIMRRTQL